MKMDLGVEICGEKGRVCGPCTSLELGNHLPVSVAMRKKIIQPYSMVKTCVLSDSGEDTDQKLCDVDLPIFNIIDPHVLYIHES